MTDLLATHRAHLERFRHSMNLVGPGPLDEHFDDCAAALVGLQPAGRWADLGTGAGFPGVVFAATFPQVQLELVDSRQKRCLFLEGVLAEGGRADVVVRCARVEDLEAGGYDGLVARAFARPPAVAEHALRLLRSGGLLVLMLNEGQAPDDAVLQLEHTVSYRLAGRSRKAVWLRKR